MIAFLQKVSKTTDFERIGQVEKEEVIRIVEQQMMTISSL